MSADTTINDIERFVALGYSQSASNCRKLLTAMQEANGRATAAEAEIRSLRAQVAQERAGIVAWLRQRTGPDLWAYQHLADAIERHEDKEPRA